MADWKSITTRHYAAERALRCRSGQKELLVRWFGPRWRERCGDLQPNRHGETERNRSGVLSVKLVVAYRRRPHQSHRRTAPVEVCCRRYRSLASRCLMLLVNMAFGWRLRKSRHNFVIYQPIPRSHNL